MPHWFYKHSGLEIISDLYLPEWTGFEQPQRPAHPDLTIRFHVVPLAERAAETTESSVGVDKYRFFAPEAGHYRVRLPGEIDIWADPGAEMSKIRAFLLGSALGAFYHLRGLLTLHASVVQVGDAAIAFCGESGAGKSTLAAWMSAQGHTLVSDDLCRVEIPQSGSVSVYPSASRLKLWRDALLTLGWDEDGLDRDHARMEKFHVPLAQDGARDPLPLSAIYLPVWGDFNLTRLTGLTALRRLIGAGAYRGELLEPIGALGGYWLQCAELLQRVPVWELSRPRDPARIAESVAAVLSHQEKREG